MERLSPDQDVLNSVEKALVKIEKQQEHDKDKVREAVQRLEKHGGVDLNLADHFEVGLKDFKVLGSPGGAKKMLIGETMPSLNGDMYIIGRNINHTEGQVVGDLVYYKIEDSQVRKREVDQKVPKSLSRFHIALIPDGDRVKLFNIGGKKLDLYFEGEIEF